MRVRATICTISALLLLPACGSGEVPGATAPDPSSASAPPPPSTRDDRDAEDVFSDLADEIDSASLVKVYTEDDDPNKLLGRPNGYTSKIAFSDSRVAKKDTQYAERDAIERGGSVEVYPDAEGARLRKEYIQTISKSGLGSEYDYVKGGILVRVTGNLPPSKARDYEEALG